MMDVKKRKWIIPVVVGGVVALAAINLSLAYLMDTETADNIITIGNVQVSIEESKFESNQTLAAGRIIDKDPKVVNTGTNDEYVFLKVAVPKRSVTLLYESNVTENGIIKHKEGEIQKEKSDYEIYKLQASGDNTDSISIGNYASPIVDFSYHKGNNITDGTANVAGWYYLPGTTQPKEETISDKKYDVYYFGYNQKLAKDKKTVQLFDKVKLKSIIDEEVKDDDAGTQVKITAYGIQADELDIDNLQTNYLTEQNVKDIFKIIKNKGMAG